MPADVLVAAMSPYEKFYLVAAAHEIASVRHSPEYDNGGQKQEGRVSVLMNWNVLGNLESQGCRAGRDSV